MSAEPTSPPRSRPPAASPLATSPPAPSVPAQTHPRSTDPAQSSGSTPPPVEDDEPRPPEAGPAAGSNGTGSGGSDHAMDTDGSAGGGGSAGDKEQEARSSEDSSASSSGPKRYTLSVVQQPRRSAEFGSNVLSRLPLAPPLIVRLDVTDADGNDVNIEPTLPFLFSHLSLLTSSSSADAPADMVVNSSSGTSVRMLYGTLVSSPHQLTLAPASSRGIYFVFPDVSVRLRGTYRLKVGLMRIAGPPGDPVNPPEHQTLATIVTDDFEITSVADYTAPNTTAMTGSMSDQGVQMYLPRTA